MLSELLQKLEIEHGISPEKGTGILNTIVEHIKEKFPPVAGMIDSVLGTPPAASFTNAAQDSTGEKFP